MVACTHDAAVNHGILTNLLTRPEAPDGVIATVEKLVTGIYLACHELLLRIPGQVKVVGFSNLPSAMLLNPSLTTVTQPAFEMGKTAASLLFSELGKGPKGSTSGKTAAGGKAVASGKTLKKETLIIPSVLVVRDSTGA